MNRLLLLLLFLLSSLSADIPETYLLPDDHPIKPILDAIFSQSDVLKSTSTLSAVGFQCQKTKKGMIVGFHEDFSEYVLKMYLETNKSRRGVDELKAFMRRINGAQLIQETLDRYGYNDIMKVPKKWLYKLPNPGMRNYVLVVENMMLCPSDENERLYKTAIEYHHLDALFNVFVDCKLIDSVYLPNIPFSQDGRISFVDTEFAGRSSSIYKKLPSLKKYLSRPMGEYWEEKIEQNRSSSHR